MATAVVGCATPPVKDGGGSLAILRQQADFSYARGHLVEAARLYEALSRTTSDPVVWARLGNCEALTGHPRRAETAYLKSLTMQPEQPAVRFNLATLYLKDAQAQLIAAGLEGAPLNTHLAQEIRRLAQRLQPLIEPALPSSAKVEHP